MREVIFYLAMIIEIAYVFMSQVPKKLENKYLLIGTAFICASDFTYHIGYNAINMSVSALSGTIAISIFLISFVVGVITKRIDFEDLFFSLFLELFLPLLTMLLTKSYELMIFVIIAVCTEHTTETIVMSMADVSSHSITRCTVSSKRV